MGRPRGKIFDVLLVFVVADQQWKKIDKGIGAVMFVKETIAAISTAVSESGIGIIRVSGEEAVQIADRIFQNKKKEFSLEKVPSHTIHYGHIADHGEVIDEVLVSVFRAPRSFTAEDTVEINCHGGVYAMKRVLELVLREGARPALPGEFTRRAFLNGRIDLSQAEAVIDVIQAKNEYALRSSVSQLKGSVNRAVSSLRGEILHETARIEAALDDPEHYSLEGYEEELSGRVRIWFEKLQRLIDTAQSGKLFHEGIDTVIAGKPNAGKSSLLNALLGEERAIVTEIAGTTRDVLRETICLGNLTLNIMDTAGIHQTEDVVEHIGVDRAKKSMEQADLIICVLDGSRCLDEDDREILKLLRGKKALVLINKSDIEQRISREEVQNMLYQLQGREKETAEIMEISAKLETGIDLLTDKITQLFYHGKISFNDQVFITNVRQKNRLEEAASYLENVSSSLRLQLPEDFLTIDLMGAYSALGEITGEETGEDLVDEIFSKFCMGK